MQKVVYRTMKDRGKQHESPRLSPSARPADGFPALTGLERAE